MRLRDLDGHRAGAAALAGLVLTALAALFVTGANAGMTSAQARPPTIIRPPSIIGTAREGQLLRAYVGRWRPETVRGAVYAFQWRLCDAVGAACTDIAKANDSLYAARRGDAGHTLRVVVTAARSGLGRSVSSAPTAPVAPARTDMPLAGVRPTVAGSTELGQALVARGGTWLGQQPVRLRYRWRRCNALGGSCRFLGETGETHILGQDDVGHTLRVLVQAQNAVATGAALSDPTTGVTGPPPPLPIAPKATSEPRISGTARVGQVLRTTRGAWKGTNPMTFAFSWRRCQGTGRPDASDCSLIGNARRATYVLRQADVGFRIRAQVTATNAAGSATGTSNPSNTILPAAPAAVAPRATGEPAITGSPRVGEVLRTTSGSWAGTQPMTLTFRWRRCEGGGKPDASDCAVITNANDATYVVREADIGFRIRSQVTATNAKGSATTASNPTDVVAAARPTNTSEPSISGAALLGNRLTASRGSWAGRAPITYAFQWLRCSAKGDSCVEIPGATDNQYVAVESDLGRTLRVRVSARNDAGSSSALSNPTNIVGRLQPPNPSGVILLRSGERSIPVTSVPRDARLIVSQVRFSPNPVRSRVRPITVRIRVVDTRGYVVRGALVFVRSVPRRTTGGNLQPTALDGWVTYRLRPLRHFPAVKGNVQFFVKAYRAGDPPLAGVAGYRLVQVRVRTAGL